MFSIFIIMEWTWGKIEHYSTCVEKLIYSMHHIWLTDEFVSQERLTIAENQPRARSPEIIKKK